MPPAADAELLFLYFIPNWDNYIIPDWYNNVNRNFIFIPVLQTNGVDLVKMPIRLKELRKLRKMTQQRLAIELNMNQNTISRYESGEREADYQTLIRFADFFNVSIDYLLERTDDPTFIRIKKADK